MEEDLFPKDFDPAIIDWFTSDIGTPTDLQLRVWNSAASGTDLVISAPTGSGKTLAGFLWVINRLMTQTDPTTSTMKAPGPTTWNQQSRSPEPPSTSPDPAQSHHPSVRVLYISPLKALNSDMHRNLELPLAAIAARAAEQGRTPALPRVGLRSGDTPEHQRRSIIKDPPEILITTPESLHILLTSQSGRGLFSGLELLILDEVHAILPNKRGSLLSLNLAFLTRLSGDFQRIAISATVARPRAVQDYICSGRFAEFESQPQPPSPVQWLSPENANKQYQLEARMLQGSGEEFWHLLTKELYQQILDHHSTLIFTPSRRSAERITRLINEYHLAMNPEDPALVYAHHGSLSREIRQQVETQLKQGRLRGIVATSSLELGIDVGTLDLVILLGAPTSAASAIQRLGRAGHQIGQTSRGLIYPLHGRETIDALVLQRAVEHQLLEDLPIPENPLDVLIQGILSMTSHHQWLEDELYTLVRSAFSFKQLSRGDFNAVLDLLEGRYADQRFRDLQPRIFRRREDGLITAKPGAALLIYSSGGTIADRGYYKLRLESSNSLIGELDEEFVWERRPGDSFALGSQVWLIRQLTHNDVLVEPIQNPRSITPFWRAEPGSRPWELSRLLGEFLEEAQDEATFNQLPGPVRHILTRQRGETQNPWPHRHHLLAEHLSSEEDPGQPLLILHTLWGAAINRPLAFIMQGLLDQQLGPGQAQVLAGNDTLLISGFSETPDAQTLLHDLPLSRLEHYLTQGLETSGYFGARFREAASRALLLPKKGFGQRQPLWISRMRSRKLWARVKSIPGFPLIKETWRTCIHDEFNLPVLYQLLEEIKTGTIRISQIHTQRISPFGEDIIWQHTNLNLYKDDTPDDTQPGIYQGDPVQDVLGNQSLRPTIPRVLIDRLEHQLQGLSADSLPRSSDELYQLFKDRLCLSPGDFTALKTALGETTTPLLSELVHSLYLLARSPGSALKSPASPTSSDTPRSTIWLCCTDSLAEIRRLLPQATGELICAPLGPDLFMPQNLATDQPTAALNFIPLGDWNAGASANQVSASYQSTDHPGTLLLRWLQSYGPVSVDPRAHNPSAPSAGDLWYLFTGREVLTEGLPELEEFSNQLIWGRRLGETEPEDDSLQLCDADNLERLLRMFRKQRAQSHPLVPPGQLPRLLAWKQGVLPAQPESGLDSESPVQRFTRAIETLLWYPAKPGAWEQFILPSRQALVSLHDMDSSLTKSGLHWYAWQGLVFFGDEQERPLFFSPPPPTQESILILDTLFPGRAGAYDVLTLSELSGLPAAEVNRLLWQLVFLGQVRGESLHTIRQGLSSDFGEKSITPSSSGGRGGGSGRRQRPGRRGSIPGFREWQNIRGTHGRWLRNQPVDNSLWDNPLTALEASKERVRLLLDRYAILLPGITRKELPLLQWGSLSRTLRLMELSGEIRSGLFFADLPGPQYMWPEDAEILEQGGFSGSPADPPESWFWMSAADPASPWGLGLPGFGGEVPRLEGNLVLCNSGGLAALLVRKGRELSIQPRITPTQSPQLISCLQHIANTLPGYSPLRISVINQEPAAASPWSGPLSDGGFMNTYHHLELWKQV